MQAPLQMSEAQRLEQRQLIMHSRQNPSSQNNNHIRAGSNKGILKEVHMFDTTPERSSLGGLTAGPAANFADIQNQLHVNALNAENSASNEEGVVEVSGNP
jgi:hypothetical protein